MMESTLLFLGLGLAAATLASILWSRRLRCTEFFCDLPNKPLASKWLPFRALCVDQGF